MHGAYWVAVSCWPKALNETDGALGRSDALARPCSVWAHEWHDPLPESLNVAPGSGMKLQSSPLPRNVSFRTPNVSKLRISLLAANVPGPSWLRPPVPTTNSRIPFGSGTPPGDWGAKRS